MIQQLRSLSIICLSFVMLTACGWHLRGASMIPENLKSLHITAQNDNSDLVRLLKQSLKSANVATPDKASDADYTLVILQEKSLKRTATVNANARISEQELTELVDFAFTDTNGKIVIPKSTVAVERVFEYDENNVIATQDEEALIRNEMRRDVVFQILNRLRQLQTTSNASAP